MVARTFQYVGVEIDTREMYVTIAEFPDLFGNSYFAPAVPRAVAHDAHRRGLAGTRQNVVQKERFTVRVAELSKRRRDILVRVIVKDRRLQADGVRGGKEGQFLSNLPLVKGRGHSGCVRHRDVGIDVWLIERLYK